ncbi:hypothetical protein JHFBIEKO_3549 [Methylobacterium mesophilicum]|uniref:hypothetical protein n=1 Tax=Methylobacterium TaxID=407 RepID=UPI0011C92421|nr:MULTISPECIES: hypothetical protein [Methylobacterium]TXN03233.1 hypothetical protein FV242_12165 [Methylobacterium sp. WL64]GJE23088.1 hypothetical protein JHFBIEKO_3549 [Methylobacterium mesophilicum]
MFEKEKNEPHRINHCLVHPAVTMAAHMAQQLHAASVSTITAAEFEELFETTAAQTDWRDHGITLRMALLMASTALQLQASLYSAILKESCEAQSNMKTVMALSAIADQFGDAQRI